MQGNELGLFCDILLKVWKDGDTYCGRYLKEDGLFESDETVSDGTLWEAQTVL